MYCVYTVLLTPSWARPCSQAACSTRCLEDTSAPLAPLIVYWGCESRKTPVFSSWNNISTDPGWGGWNERRGVGERCIRFEAHFSRMLTSLQWPIAGSFRSIPNCIAILLKNTHGAVLTMITVLRQSTNWLNASYCLRNSSRNATLCGKVSTCWSS